MSLASARTQTARFVVQLKHYVATAPSIYFTVLVFYIFFIVRRCESLLPPANGFIVGQCLTEYSSVCHMQCNAGYVANGDKYRVCDVGPNNVMEWTGSPWQCIGKTVH